MCEINPKRKQFFRLEFFTNIPMTDERWKDIVSYCILKLEQEFNQSGEIRVHIHHDDLVVEENHNNKKETKK